MAKSHNIVNRLFEAKATAGGIKQSELEWKDGAYVNQITQAMWDYFSVGYYTARNSNKGSFVVAKMDQSTPYAGFIFAEKPRVHGEYKDAKAEAGRLRWRHPGEVFNIFKLIYTYSPKKQSNEVQEQGVENV